MPIYGCDIFAPLIFFLERPDAFFAPLIFILERSDASIRNMQNKIHSFATMQRHRREIRRKHLGINYPALITSNLFEGKHAIFLSKSIGMYLRRYTDWSYFQRPSWQCKKLAHIIFGHSFRATNAAPGQEERYNLENRTSTKPPQHSSRHARKALQFKALQFFRRKHLTS
jgi:hypothetical protein